MTGGNYTGLTTLTNNSIPPVNPGVLVAAGKTLETTVSIVNNGTFTNFGKTNTPLITNGGVFTSTGAVSSTVTNNTNSGVMNLQNVFTAATSFNNSGIVNLTGDLAGVMPAVNNSGLFNLNNRSLTLNGGTGTLTNTGTVTAFGGANAINGNVTNNNLITLQNNFGVTTDAPQVQR